MFEDYLNGKLGLDHLEPKIGTMAWHDFNDGKQTANSYESKIERVPFDPTEPLGWDDKIFIGIIIAGFFFGLSIIIGTLWHNALDWVILVLKAMAMGAVFGVLMCIGVGMLIFPITLFSDKVLSSVHKYLPRIKTSVEIGKWKPWSKYRVYLYIGIIAVFVVLNVRSEIIVNWENW